MYRFLECAAGAYMTRSVTTVTRRMTLRELEELFETYDFNSSRGGRRGDAGDLDQYLTGGLRGSVGLARPTLLYLRLKKVIRLYSRRDRLQTLRLEYRAGLWRRQKI